MNGQKNLVNNIAHRLDLKINNEAVDLIVESIGNDSSLINTELQKLALLSEATKNISNTNETQIITKE